MLWGGNPVAVSFGVDALPPIAVAAIRFAMATAFMFFWCWWERCGLRLSREQWVPVLVAGIGLFAQISLFNVGVFLSNSSHGAMLIPTFVFWVNLLDHYVTKSDVLTPVKMLGLLMATAGVVLILSVAGTSSDGERSLDTASIRGDLVLLLSALVLAIKIAYIKHALKTVPPGKLIFWHDLIGVILFCAYSLMFERLSFAALSLTTWTALVYQGVVVAGICFAIQARLLMQHSASQIAVFSFVTPLCGVLFAVAFRGDLLSPWLIVSTICVAAGIWLIQGVRN